MKYYLICLLILFLSGGAVLAEEKSDMECHWRIFGCIGVKTWMDISNSNNVVEGINATGTARESIYSEESTNKWDIYFGVAEHKLSSFMGKGKIFENIEIDAYVSYGNNYEFQNMPNTNVLNTATAKRETSFKRNFALRFKIPLF